MPAPTLNLEIDELESPAPSVPSAAGRREALQRRHGGRAFQPDEWPLAQSIGLPRAT